MVASFGGLVRLTGFRREGFEGDTFEGRQFEGFSRGKRGDELATGVGAPYKFK